MANPNPVPVILADQPAQVSPTLRRREADAPGSAKWLDLCPETAERRAGGCVGAFEPARHDPPPWANLRTGRK